MNQPKRKVGQDMIVKKKSQPAGAVSRTRATAPVIKKSTTQKTAPQKVVPKTVPTIDRDIDHIVPRQPVYRTPARGGVMWYGIGILLIVLMVTVISFFQRAIIAVTLQETPITLSPTMTELSAKPGDTELGFKTVTATDTQNIIVPATGKQPVRTNATGQVTLVSSSPSQIIVPKGSGLTPQGQTITYLTDEQIVIPAGTETVPVTKTVTITASSAGATYNLSEPTLFTAKDFPQLLIRSEQPVTGGFVGEQNIVSETALDLAKTSLMTLFSQSRPGAFLIHQIPDGFILPENTISTLDPVFTQESLENNQVKIMGTRTISGMLVRQDHVKEFLRETIIPESDRPFTEVVDISELVFEKGGILNQDRELTTLDTFPVIISGTIIARATVPTETLLASVAYQKKSVAVDRLMNFPGVIRASVSVRPIWFFKIPNKIRQLELVINYQQ